MHTTWYAYKILSIVYAVVVENVEMSFLSTWLDSVHENV